MNLLVKSLSAIALSLNAITSFAANPSPTYLITHNNTSEDSNAYVAGVPSLYPTLAHSTKKVYWNAVKIACYGHTDAGKCAAVIKMIHGDNYIIEVGLVTLDLNTGDINPKQLSNNGYTFTVDGPGEATINKN